MYLSEQIIKNLKLNDVLQGVGGILFLSLREASTIIQMKQPQGKEEASTAAPAGGTGEEGRPGKGQGFCSSTKTLHRTTVWWDHYVTRSLLVLRGQKTWVWKLSSFQGF